MLESDFNDKTISFHNCLLQFISFQPVACANNDIKLNIEVFYLAFLFSQLQGIFIKYLKICETLSYKSNHYGNFYFRYILILKPICLIKILTNNETISINIMIKSLLKYLLLQTIFMQI